MFARIQASDNANLLSLMFAAGVLVSVARSAGLIEISPSGGGLGEGLRVRSLSPNPSPSGRGELSKPN